MRRASIRRPAPHASAQSLSRPSRRAGAVWAAFSLLLLGGCGREAVLWVQVEAPLVCPQACDALRIDITRADGTPVLDARYDLRNRTPSFPQSASFTARKSQELEAPGLRVSVSVLQGSALATPWSQGTQDVVLHDDRTTAVTFAFAAP